MKKKGLSPVIATILLIALAVIIALIIYLWARAFIGEKVQKDVGGGLELAQEVCKKVIFEAEYSNEKIKIKNTGNVPIYQIKVYENDIGSIVDLGTLPGNVGSGEIFEYDASKLSSVPSGKITIVPVILGEGDNNKVAYPCSKEQGLEIEV